MKRYSLRMVRGLVSAAAVAGRVVDYGDLEEVQQLLDTHALDCTCRVCVAYVKAATEAEGLIAAMEAMDKEKKA
jgi:hypothetical protein